MFSLLRGIPKFYRKRYKNRMKSQYKNILMRVTFLYVYVCIIKINNACIYIFTIHEYDG